MPGDERIGAGRQARDTEFPVAAGDGEKWVIENAQIGGHPWMHVAFDVNHFGLGKRQAIDRIDKTFGEILRWINRGLHIDVVQIVASWLVTSIRFDRLWA